MRFWRVSSLAGAASLGTLAIVRGMASTRRTRGSDLRFVGDLASALVRLLLARWPELLAIELASRIVATLTIGLAGVVGASTSVGGLALTALASLVTLTAIILQVLVLLRSLRSAPQPDRGRGRWRRVARGLASTMLPAFVLLSAWGIFRDDISEYALTALESVDWFDGGISAGTVLDVPVDVLTIGLLVGCLVLRGLLRRFERKGRTALAPVALLVEGLWVYLAVQVLGTVIGWGLDWFDGTRAASWWDGLVTIVDSTVGDAPAAIVAWLVDGWHVVTVPVMWLALASITLIGSRPELATQPPATRLGRWWQARVDAMPSPIDDVVEEVTDDLQDRWVPVSQSVRSVAGAGVVALAIFVLAWYVLEAATGWLTVGLMHLAGPTPDTLAIAVATVGELAGDTIARVLELSLAVAALDALRLAAQRSRATAVAASPTVSTTTGSVTPSGTTKPTAP